jgi:hypothetical protein
MFTTPAKVFSQKSTFIRLVTQLFKKVKCNVRDHSSAVVKVRATNWKVAGSIPDGGIGIFH